MNISKKHPEQQKIYAWSIGKSKIRILILALILTLLTSDGVKAQGMPVYDNTNFISLTKTLVESAKQTTQLLKTVEFLKQQKENIDKVSNIIKQLKAVRELSQNNQKLYRLVQNDLRDILNSPFIKPDEVSRISESFNAIIEQSLEDLDFITKILSSNTLKMTDAERTEFLKTKELQSKEMVIEIEQKTRRYKEIIAFRDLQKKINNRETEY